MNTLDQISIYPIKSCSGIQLESARVESRGFPLDRRWMLIEANGDFISQRNTPQLGQFQISVHDNHLHVQFSDKSPLKIQMELSKSTIRESRIWKDNVSGKEVSNVCDDWFSEILNRQVHLIHMDESVSRPLIKESLPQDRSFEVSFADGYPYLLTNQASLDDLNQRLTTHIPMDRFRSNLVVSGFEAFAEDDWKQISIGDVVFQVVKPCARCHVTTIDQKSGIQSKEPLKTLASYRKQDGKVMFGMNLIALTQGTVTHNDPVKVLN